LAAQFDCRRCGLEVARAERITFAIRRLIRKIFVRQGPEAVRSFSLDG